MCSQALEAVNTQLRELYPESEELFDVVLMTNNHAYVGLRLINTINHHSELLIHMNNKNFVLKHTCETSFYLVYILHHHFLYYLFL